MAASGYQGVVPVKRLYRRTILTLFDRTIANVTKDGFYFLFIQPESPGIRGPRCALSIEPRNQCESNLGSDGAAAEIIRFARVACQIKQAPRLALAVSYLSITLARDVVSTGLDARSS